MKEFKIRASAAGKLMTNSRTKGEISQTSKSFIEEWVKEQIYGIRKEIYSKEMTKGTEKENFSIDKAIEWLNLPLVIKNEKYFEDEYFCGTPDLLLTHTVIDIKTSWDCFTFPLFENDIPTKDYYYQLQVYMHLTGRCGANLCYILLDNEKEDYINIDKKYRIKTFKFDYDERVIETLKEKVIEARGYINTIISEL